MRHFLRRAALTIAPGLVIVAAAWLILELVVRIAGIEAPTWPRRGKLANAEGVRVDPLLGPLPKPNWMGEMPKGFPVENDARGFRASGFAPPEHARARIAFLGDSCTYGWGVGTQETYIARLDALQRADGEPAYELVNAAFPGHSAIVGRYVLRERVQPLDPDIVVLAFSANNAFRFTLRSDSERFRFHSLRRLALRSRLFEILSGYYRRLTMDENARHPRAREGLRQTPLSEIRRVAPLEEFEEAIRFMVGEARAGGARVVLLSFPRAFELSNAFPHEDATFQARSVRSDADARPLALFEFSCLDYRAADAMEQLRREGPAWRPVRSDDPALRDLLARGSKAYLEGDFAASIATYQQARAFEPDSPSVLYELGVAEIAQGQTASGLERLRRADGLACSTFLSYQVALWKLAVELSVPLVDLMLVLQPHTDESLFIDAAHPSAIGHRRIAQALWPVLEREAEAAAGSKDSG